MLGWLKRKPAPVESEPEQKNDEPAASGDVRLERLLGRLGSEPPHEGGATVIDAPRPRPAPVSTVALAPQPAPPVTEPSAAGRPAAEDPEEALLKELYPDSLGAAEAASAGPVEQPSSPESDPPPSAEDTVAADKSAAEAAAVLADIDRIVAGDPEEPPADAEPPAAEAAAAAVLADIDRIVAAEAAAAPAGAEPLAADAAEPPEQAAPATDAPEPEAAAAPALPDEPSPAVKIEMSPVDLGEEPLDEPPPAEVAPLPLTAPKARGKGARKAAPAPAPAPSGEVKPPANASGAFPPMFVIAVASQKGGAGKTTLAAHLAVRAGLSGNGPVVLIDTDPQGSLAEWWHARSDETPALAVVKPEQLAANLAELRSYGTAIAVIDTPPALTGSIEQVIAMADLLIIPVRPSPHDLRAAGGTVEMAHRAGKPFMFVVNGAAPRASITAQAVAALSEHGRVAPVILYQRTEYAASMIDGRTVVEAAASGRSAQEIAELWQCVHAQLGMRAAA